MLCSKNNQCLLTPVIGVVCVQHNSLFKSTVAIIVRVYMCVLRVSVGVCVL